MCTCCLIVKAGKLEVLMFLMRADSKSVAKSVAMVAVDFTNLTLDAAANFSPKVSCDFPPSFILYTNVGE